jgi:hypothetical protein
MFIIIALLVTIIAIGIDWLKDKSTLVATLDLNWFKYAAVFVSGAFLTGYLLNLPVAHDIFCATAGAAVYFFWTFIVNLFKKK